jgi:hypothetical protein
MRPRVYVDCDNAVGRGWAVDVCGGGGWWLRWVVARSDFQWGVVVVACLISFTPGDRREGLEVLQACWYWLVRGGICW